MKIKLLNSAKEDLISGYKFYDLQELGLGDYFLNSLFSEIDSLQLYAGIHPIKFDKYYCMLVKKFPFAIYYKVKDETSFVYAVLDCRQDPQQLIRRLNA